MVPSVPIAAECCLVKFAGVPCRVSEEKHHRLAVNEPAFGYLVNAVWHGRRFVKQVKRGRVSGMLAREPFRILFATRLRATKPTSAVPELVHARARDVKPMGR